jgi:CheY-like chemotaxis protein
LVLGHSVHPNVTVSIRLTVMHMSALYLGTIVELMNLPCNDRIRFVEKLLWKRVYMSVVKRLINIVDDDASVCRALKILLTAYGFNVKSFPSADDFFSTVPEHAPGCLILDIHMPGLDGWEAQQRLLTSGSKCPVIIMSADKNSGLKERALKSGAVGFLLKPFPAKELVDLIHLAFGPKVKIPS